MKIGPKYKIARRLGNSVFEKTQTEKFAISTSRRTGAKGKGKGPKGAKTPFASQILEKQRVRFTYSITAKQLSNYAKKVIASRVQNQSEAFYSALEMRLDSIILRSGFAKTRRMARQLAAHGHFQVNGTRSTIPSHALSKGDVITVRSGSQGKTAFADLEKQVKETIVAPWIKVDPKKFEITVIGVPVYKSQEVPFDLSTVLQFYKR